MKYLLIVYFFAFLMTGTCAFAQQAEEISFEQGDQFSINDTMSIDSLISLDGDWAYLKQTLGEPMDEHCKEYHSILGFEPACSYMYDGLEIYYANVGSGPELAEIVITSSAAFLQYEDIVFKVGDPISKLQPHFPEAYASRGMVENPSSEGSPYWIRLNIGGSVANISFQYNPDSETIEKIRFFQVLT